MWRYDEDASGTVASTERFFYMYDDRWRMVGAFWDSGATPQEFFVYHAAGNAGRGGGVTCTTFVVRRGILRDRACGLAATPGFLPLPLRGVGLGSGRSTTVGELWPSS